MSDWMFCTSGSAISKAGTHAYSVAIASGSLLLQWYREAEGRIGYETNTKWSGSWVSLEPETRFEVSNICSSIIGMNIIAYDNTGYLAREADMLMNLNNNIVNTGIRLLNDKNNHTLLTP